MGTNRKRANSPAAAKAPERRFATRPLSAEVPALTKVALGRKGFAEAGIISHWREIVGEDLARATQPVKIAFAKGQKTGGAITLRCGGAAALEVQHLAPVMLERLNAYFGYQAIERIKIAQSQLPPARAKPKRLPDASAPDRQEIDDHVEGVRDEALRERLRRLGLAMRQRRRADP